MTKITVVAIAAIVAILSFLVYFSVKQGSISGEAGLTRKIEIDNEAAIKKSDEYRGSLYDCYQSGGVFNFQTGKCNQIKP